MNSDRWTKKLPQHLKSAFIGNQIITGWDEIEDYLISLVYSEVKYAYMAGYRAGAEDVIRDVHKYAPEVDLEFSPADNRIGGERKFLAWEKE